MPKKIQFNEAELIGSMQEALAHSTGKLPVKSTNVPRQVVKMTPARIAKIRGAPNASTLRYPG